MLLADDNCPILSEDEGDVDARLVQGPPAAYATVQPGGGQATVARSMVFTKAELKARPASMLPTGSVKVEAPRSGSQAAVKNSAASATLGGHRTIAAMLTSVQSG